MEFPKIYNLLVRNEEDKKHCLPGTRSNPAFEQVNSWLVLEKIDGTNIRLILDWGCCGPLYEARGRSDAATLPKNFSDEAVPHIGAVHMAMALLSIEPEAEPGSLAMIVYGEGYGPGIQKGGGAYAPHKSFRVFDVATCRIIEEDGERRLGHRLWRTWADVEVVASVLGVRTVPVLAQNETTAYIEATLPSWKLSTVAFEEGDIDGIEMEGVVARTDPYLFTYRGDRVMFKLKHKDIPA
jgi:hypothetical protein